MAQDNYPIPGVPVWQNPNRMSGALCFANTRVPVVTLFENLEGGVSLEEFLDAFEGVKREHAVAVLKYGRRYVEEAAAGAPSRRDESL
jgi:uncharacterized protein (DUF433 family)